jgi:hypothetical protein
MDFVSCDGDEKESRIPCLEVSSDVTEKEIVMGEDER